MIPWKIRIHLLLGFICFCMTNKTFATTESCALPDPMEQVHRAVAPFQEVGRHFEPRSLAQNLSQQFSRLGLECPERVWPNYNLRNTQSPQKSFRRWVESLVERRLWPREVPRVPLHCLLSSLFYLLPSLIPYHLLLTPRLKSIFFLNKLSL